jgi:heat shock protein HslJ
MVLFVLAMASCKSKTPVASTEEIIYQPESQIITFQSVHLKLDALKSGTVQKVPTAEITLAINLNENAYSGKSGCNRYFGKVEKISEDQLKFYPGGITEMACQEDVMEWESNYLRALTAGIFALNVQGDKYIFVNTEGTASLIFSKVGSEENSEE